MHCCTSSVMISLKIIVVTNQDYFFTGTDSLVYAIKSKDICEDFSKDKEMYYFSNYSTKSKN